MRKHMPKNERIKRQYAAYLEDAKRMSPVSVDQVMAALTQFEVSTGYKDFALFHIEQARKYRRTLNEATNPQTGKPLSKATIYARLMALKAFYHWLAGQSGYKSKLIYDHAEYFNPSNSDSRIAKAVREKPAPTLEQIRHVLANMNFTTDLEKRDRAVVAFAILSGARDNAIASMQIGHVDLRRRRIFQDARDVRTKFSKSFYSDFFPVGEEVEGVFTDWVEYLTKEKLYGPNDPLFPSTRVGIGPSGHFEPLGLSRKGWRNAAGIRRIFKTAFTAAGLPYFNPHSFRDCLVNMGNRLCTTPEEFKAWSQNLGHDHVATTLRNYGNVSGDRQSEVISVLGRRMAKAQGTNDAPEPEEIARVVAWFSRKEA